MVDYVRARRKAGEALKKHGAKGLLRVPGVGTPGDEAFRTGSGGTSTDYNIDYIFEEYDERAVDGTTVRQGDRKITFSAEGLGVTVGQDHQVVADGSVFEIVNLMPLSPAGVVVLYQAQVRRVGDA